MKTFETIRVETARPGTAVVTMTRPDVRNAFNDVLIDELATAFFQLTEEEDLRCVLLRGEGPCFCAGADLNWMKASSSLSEAENEESARRMAAMFRAIATCSVPVVGVIHGHALGGGAGLVGAVDVAVGAEEAKLGFTEVRLGIIPAVISPFVLRKVSQTHARRYFLTGELFDGREAGRIGLAQKVVPREHIEDEVQGIVDGFLLSGPAAVRQSKKLIDAVSGRNLDEAVDLTAPWIASLRVSEEGQAGMTAFLNKEKAPWVEDGS